MGFTALAGILAGPTYVAGDKWGYQTAERARLNFNALASARYVQPLVFSKNTALPLVAVITDHPEYWDALIDWDDLGGFTVRARVEVITQNAATTVTPVIWNQTAGSAAVTGAAGSQTAWGTSAEQLLTIPAASGIVRYRFRLTPSNATHPVRGAGVVEIYV